MVHSMSFQKEVEYSDSYGAMVKGDIVVVYYDGTLLESWPLTDASCICCDTGNTCCPQIKDTNCTPAVKTAGFSYLLLFVNVN